MLCGVVVDGVVVVGVDVGVVVGVFVVIFGIPVVVGVVVENVFVDDEGISGI